MDSKELAEAVLAGLPDGHGVSANVTSFVNVLSKAEAVTYHVAIWRNGEILYSASAEDFFGLFGRLVEARTRYQASVGA